MTEPRQWLLIGNSVSLAPSAAVVPYPELVTAAARDSWRLHALVRSGATVEEIEPDAAALMAAHQPAAVVLQVGINECAPRPLSTAQRRCLGGVRPLWARQLVINALHRWRPYIIRARPLAQLTPLDRFAASVSRLVGAARTMGGAVLLLPITRVTAVAEMRTPYTNREVARYNAVLRAMADRNITWVEETTLLCGMSPDEFSVTPDSVHLSRDAHQRMAEWIVQWLKTLE